jgi:hypothetical protein
MHSADIFFGRDVSVGLDSPISAMSRDPGDFPIFGGSTQSVAQTVGRL